jgi:iron complex transport system substrate-binding protein
MKYVSMSLLFLILTGCKDQQTSSEILHSALTLKYAKGFWIKESENYKDVFVKQTADSISPIKHYRLISKSKDINSFKEPGVVCIPVPITNIVCTSTTHIPLLDYLGDSDKLIGFPNTDYISSPSIRSRIDKGDVKELGIEDNLNIELLIQLKPSIVMTYTMAYDFGSLKKVNELGVPIVINAEFLEQHPLGRAEWIKFIALFLEKEIKADSIFNWIESQYQEHQQLASTFEVKPTVLTGIPYGGIWYLPGGQNYGARFFEDAGCYYLWRDDPSNGFLKLSLETVFDRALTADYWIGVGSFETYSDLKSADDRFQKFAAFQNRKIYNYNNRIGATGGNEYLELGYLRPDLILKDLIQITHPNEFSDPQMYFYKELK